MLPTPTVGGYGTRVTPSWEDRCSGALRRTSADNAQASVAEGSMVSIGRVEGDTPMRLGLRVRSSFARRILESSGLRSSSGSDGYTTTRPSYVQLLLLAIQFWRVTGSVLIASTPMMACVLASGTTAW
jgi:hypothetical protein